jgi:hypothetical protein
MDELQTDVPSRPAPGGLFDAPAPTQSPGAPQSRQIPGSDEAFDYRPIPLLSPITLILGFVGLSAFLGVVGLPVALVGTGLGIAACLKYRGSRGVYGGLWMAVAGLVLSVVGLAGGSTLFAFHVATEVPEGYRRISFSKDISKKEFVVENNKLSLHPEVKALDGEKVFVKGYMYPTGVMQGLTSFILVKDNQQCCFGGNPAVGDMIQVKMSAGKTAEFFSGRVAVSGTFHTLDPKLGGALAPVYTLDGDSFDLSRTPL